MANDKERVALGSIAASAGLAAASRANLPHGIRAVAKVGSAWSGFQSPERR